VTWRGGHVCARPLGSGPDLGSLPANHRSRHTLNLFEGYSEVRRGCREVKERQREEEIWSGGWLWRPTVGSSRSLEGGPQTPGRPPSSGLCRRWVLVLMHPRQSRALDADSWHLAPGFHPESWIAVPFKPPISTTTQETGQSRPGLLRRLGGGQVTWRGGRVRARPLRSGTRPGQASGRPPELATL
jgi:hypothetical protein